MTELTCKLLLRLAGTDHYIDLPVDNLAAAKKIVAAQNFPQAAWRADGRYAEARFIQSDGYATELDKVLGSDDIMTTEERMAYLNNLQAKAAK